MKSSILLLLKILILLIPFLGTPLYSQSNLPIIEISRVSGSIIFDGKPDEEVWTEQKPFEFLQFQPDHGQKPTEQIDVRMGFDDNFFYVGASLYYQDISMIKATGKKRDYAQQTCDWFGFHLDTYNDNQNAMVFYTNPNGLRFDASVKRDLKSFEQDVNFSWNTYWEVKTTIDDKGWYAEFKIPLSSLRFQEKDGSVSMGLTIARFIPEKNETDVYPDIPLDYSLGSWKPSLSNDVLFDGLQSKKPLYFTPYILAGYGREAVLNEAETGYLHDLSPKLDAGLDLKVGLTNNLTMDVTVNTDFAQVEADDQQINLSRYSIFFPEKRVFFQEKADAFDFSMGGPNNLFYSRRIGLNEDEPVRILGGFRVSGRAGEWDIGLLDLQTAKITELPSENFGVVRLKRTFINEHSYIGGMVTSRIGFDGSYNVNPGLDCNIRMFGDDYMSLHIVRTLEDGMKSDAEFLDPMRAQFVWERRREEGFAYDATLTYSGRDFNPGMGFVWRDAYYGIYSKISYGWLSGQSSKLLRHSLHTEYIRHNSILTNSLESLMVQSGWKFETKNGLNGDIVYNHEVQVLTDTLEICEDVCIYQGNYKYNFLSTEWTLPPSLPVVGMIMTETGTFYDGWKASATLMPIWSVSSSVDISATYRVDYISMPDRDISFINHIVGIKGLWTFSTKTSLAGFVQYNTAIDDVIANVRFRYNPREGIDFYLVYNEGLNTDPYSNAPKLPVSDSRTLMAKFTYTFGR